MKTSNKKKLNTTGATCKEFLDSVYNSIYAYIMTWVYCQLSLEDYSCHVTSRDICHVTIVNFLANKKKIKKRTVIESTTKTYIIGTEHYCWSGIMSTVAPMHIPRNTKIILLLNANTEFISKG